MTQYEAIEAYQLLIDLLKQEILDIPLYCKDRYNENKKLLTGEHSDILQGIKLEAILCAYIYNKNREKAFKTFKKLKCYHQDNLNEYLFESKPSKIQMVGDDGEIICLTGEESLRIEAMLMKLIIQRFELMLQQTF